MNSIEYELHNAPFQAEPLSINRRCERAGINQTAVNPMWEPLSYSPNKAEFNRNTPLTASDLLGDLAVAQFRLVHPEHLVLRVGVFG